jgi:uncharacterized protein
LICERSEAIPLMEPKNPNRLINEKSPYLLQHAHNPVDWYSWGDDAFEKARTEDKPIFLSIGYSTCYWCHVMEREVFENDSIAELMNKYFINIKVDREERPDVDRVYMSALQSMTGSGGWPMSMFLTPELKPFYGATYVPPRAKYGRSGFEDLTNEINDAWHNRRGEILKAGDEITSFLKSQDKLLSEEKGIPGKEAIENCYNEFLRRFDSEYGGFDNAPKFPRPSGFNFLLRYYYRNHKEEALKMVDKTLVEMAKGGIHDHIGGGFHRYSVDRFWRVPHFEKMLYDQAQLASIYTDVYQITKNIFYADIVKDTLNYVIRKFSHKGGGFYSAEDAESIVKPPIPSPVGADLRVGPLKEEGAFYVWEKSDIDKLLGQQNSEIFCHYFDVGERGNIPAGSDPHNVFTDKNILYVSKSISETANHFNVSTDRINEIINESKKILFDAREKGPHPHLDDKILVSWNGLMISSFARAYQIFNEMAYLDASEKSANFIFSKLYEPKTHTLLHRFRDGEARFDGALEDYAFFIQALLDLYEASFKQNYLEIAVHLCSTMISLFYDNENGGFFDVSANAKNIIVRTKEYYDSAEPAGNSVAVTVLLRISQFTDNKELHEKAGKSLSAFSAIINSQPYAVPQMLCALDSYLHSAKEIIIAGRSGSSDTEMMLQEVYKHFIPDKVLIFAESGKENKLIPHLSSIVKESEKATAYVCENYSCKLPTSDINELNKLLQP